MDPDDNVCLCFHVSLRKIRTFLKVENPSVPSLISECLSAGTGCRWCVPFLKHLHDQHTRNVEPDLKISPEGYATARLTYKATGDRPPAALPGAEPLAQPPAESPPTSFRSTDPGPSPTA